MMCLSLSQLLSLSKQELEQSIQQAGTDVTKSPLDCEVALSLYKEGKWY